MKDWNKSRTIILNGLSGLVSLIIMLATLFAGPEVQALGISPEIARIAAIVLLVTNVVNVWLRTLTSEPLRLPGQEAEPGTIAARGRL